jgi:hypothetical protein
MAYTKTTWEDEVLSGPAEYTISGLTGDRTIALATSVTQAGTDFTAAKMNNIENGIETLDTTKYDSSDLASQVEAEAGTDNTVLMTPLRTKQAIDEFAVKLTGDETVAGIKTFSSFPITPSSAPTTDYQIANKKYVDDTALKKASGYVLDGGTYTTVTIGFEPDLVIVVSEDTTVMATKVYTEDSGFTTFTVDSTGGGKSQISDAYGIETTATGFKIRTSGNDFWYTAIG